MAGLAQYSKYFENPLFSGVVREIPVDAKFISGDYLPRLESYETEWNEPVIVRQQDMAQFVDSGAELPLTDRDPLRTVSGSIADMGQRYIVTKKELGALMDKGNPKRKELAEKQLLNKVKTIKANIDARLEWLAWQLLGNGALVYNGGKVMLSHDFGVTFVKTPTTKWDDINPTIIADYEAWNQAYVDKNGMIADDYVTSLKVARLMMNDSGVRKAVTGLSDKLITLAELNAFLEGRQMAPIRPFDASVTYRDVDNAGVRVTQRLLSEKKGIFLKKGSDIGNMILGPTIEGNMEPGIFGRTIHKEDPMSEIIEVVASAFPKASNPDLIGITNILL